MTKWEKYLKVLARKRKDNQKRILDWARKVGRAPIRFSEDPIESYLAGKMHGYLSKTSDSFDPDFRRKIHSLFELQKRSKRNHSPARRKREILSFIKKNGRVPSQNVPNETVAGRVLAALLSKKHNMYDPDIAEAVKELDPCFRTYIPLRYRRAINSSLKKSRVSLKAEKTFSYRLK